MSPRASDLIWVSRGESVKTKSHLENVWLFSDSDLVESILEPKSWGKLAENNKTHPISCDGGTPILLWWLAIKVDWLQVSHWQRRLPPALHHQPMHRSCSAGARAWGRTGHQEALAIWWYFCGPMNSSTRSPTSRRLFHLTSLQVPWWAFLLILSSYSHTVFVHASI